MVIYLPCAGTTCRTEPSARMKRKKKTELEKENNNGTGCDVVGQPVHLLRAIEMS